MEPTAGNPAPTGPSGPSAGGDARRPGEGAEGTPRTDLGSLGDRIWLVLGGGGLKGLAHVGVVRALGEAGVRVEGVIGTSIGALVGALYSSGMGWREMRRRARELRRTDIVRINRRAVLINGIRQVSLFRGDALKEYYAEVLPEDGWAAMDLPLLVNAVDLATGKTEWFGTGARTDVSLVEAVYASSALPVLYPPALLNGQALVDGGTEHPMGLLRAEAEEATGVIAVDVGAGEVGDVDRILQQGMAAVHQRIFSIMTYRRRRDMVARWDGPPLMYVRPRLDGYGAFDFQHVEYFVEEGYRSMSTALGAGNGPGPRT